ncbi:MAG: ABC transporter ATP-binding protein [Candidatus Saccharibacteria bacterium]|nr:ABC transporter ATP-binding protein [Candidatus Saccharibacteria bacterium]
MTPKTPPPVIKLKGLHKSYGYGDAATSALDGMDLTINKGEFVAIMGPSGCGKTTLLNILGLLDKPTDGEYELSGEPVDAISQSRRAQIRREQIGFVFQSFNLLPRQTVIENVALPLIYSGQTHTSRLMAASKTLRLFHLQNREYYMPHQLSGGQMQRVAIARALVNQPSIILADEPTGNLDSKSSEIIMQELSEIHNRGNTIIMVTHNSRLTSYADRIIYMLDGRIDTDSKVVPKKPDLAAKIPLSAKRRKVNASKKKSTKAKPAVKKVSKKKVVKK